MSIRQLIAEDDPVSMKVISSYLSPFGECDLAENGELAVMKVRESLEKGERYDLICLDIMMPTKDGQQALNEIRQLEEEFAVSPSEKAKIIMTTSLSDVNNMWQAFSKKCDAYLVKPIKREKLVEELTKLGLIEA